MLAQDDISRQNSQFQNFIAQKVNAIIVVTASTQATPKRTQLATAASLPRIDVTHPPAKHKRQPKVVFVGFNEVDSGTLQTQKVLQDAALKQGKGQVVPPKVWVPFELVTSTNMGQYLKKN